MTMENYLDRAFTPAVRAVQERKGSSGVYDPQASAPEALDRREIDHITSRDSFYMASVSEAGWPYVQHRGGDAGFVKVLDPTTIGWLEQSGNRQYLGAGNISADDRVSLILVDYPNRTRLKLRGHATYHPQPTAELVEVLGGAGLGVDGAITVGVVAYDWNCPKYITPRYAAEDIQPVIAKLEDRIAELEGSWPGSEPSSG